MVNTMNLKENERIDDLELNGLKIIQNTEGFCFGIDSVLLSDFAKDIRNNANVMDLGTGTAILPILLSAKTKAKSFIGVEIQEKVSEMAQRSVQLNNLENIITIINNDIKKLPEIYELGSFDVIVTNPPYMKDNTGLQNEDYEKLISRHEVKCTINDIAQISFKLLKDKGEIYMVHRPDRLVDIMSAFRKNRLEIKSLRMVHSKEGMQACLVLIKAVKNGKPFLRVNKPLFIYNDNGTYTQEIKRIYNKI